MPNNESCPITLEALSEMGPGEVFVHADVGFSSVALYEYLCQAPRFCNPVNRLPLSMADLQRLETCITDQFGEDAIVRRSMSEPMVLRGGGTGASRSSTSSSDGSVDWLDEGEVVSRLSTTVVEDDEGEEVGRQRTIRLRVDIDMRDFMPVGRERGRFHPRPSTPATNPEDEDDEEEDDEDEDEEEEEEEEEEEGETVRAFADREVELHLLPLPPRRTFLSVMEMYQDSGRERRMCERLSLMQFLEYEAMSQLRSMMDLSQGQQFHRFVWQQTSMDVIDTVTMYLSQGTPATPSWEGEEAQVVEDESIEVASGDPPLASDYNLEVQYTECWEVYRTVVMQRFERQYRDTMRDIFALGRADFDATLSCHRSTVESSTDVSVQDCTTILEMLDRVQRDIGA